MDDPPMTPIRKKRRSSLRIAGELVKSGEAQGLVSAGNTGAVMATAKLVIGGIEVVERPALATWIPQPQGRLARPGRGRQQRLQGVPPPAVRHHGERLRLPGHRASSTPGWHSSPSARRTSRATTSPRRPSSSSSRATSTSSGNVEGHGIFAGDADVIVTDGFTGNVVLKTGESVYEYITGALRQGFGRSLRTKARLPALQARLPAI